VPLFWSCLYVQGLKHYLKCAGCSDSVGVAGQVLSHCDNWLASLHTHSQSWCSLHHYRLIFSPINYVPMDKMYLLNGTFYCGTHICSFCAEVCIGKYPIHFCLCNSWKLLYKITICTGNTGMHSNFYRTHMCILYHFLQSLVKPVRNLVTVCFTSCYCIRTQVLC
jgi:hypothetical protein